MADPNNIQQLLATLAQSAQAGTPLPGQPPLPGQAQAAPPGGAIPPPYAAQYPTPQPAAAGGFVLPQPKSSGALDLSSIRPSNSGSVSLGGGATNFQDALSKARSIAAGAGYGGSGRDSRGGRDYGRSRSRSRSPGRGRDGYNAYDDRNRDRRAPRNDDRPFSPGASTGGDSEVIGIESGLVGLIIGQQGKNLRKVEQDTQARVQFLTGPESSGPTRQCKISGTPQARAHAKAEIQRIISENGNPVRGGISSDSRDGRDSRDRRGGRQSAQQSQPKGPPSDNPEDTLQIMVPNRTVGLIIGRGGETIKDLQERSGCHVNILGEDHSVNGLRPVNLIGNPSAQQVAKTMILDVVDSDNKSLASGAPTSGRQQQFQPTGDGAKIESTMHVPSEAVGMIIGKGGETIKDMQNVSGCKINVSQPQGRDVQREIGLVGTHSAIEAAKGLIMEKVRAVEEKNHGGSGGGRGQGGYDQSYSQQPAQQSNPWQQFNQPAQGYQQQQPAQSEQAAGAPAADPYAPYGGYENYVRMWYAATAQQAGQQQPGQGGPAPQ